MLWRPSLKRSDDEAFREDDYAEGHRGSEFYRLVQCLGSPDEVVGRCSSLFSATGAKNVFHAEPLFYRLQDSEDARDLFERGMCLHRAIVAALKIVPDDLVDLRVVLVCSMALGANKLLGDDMFAKMWEQGKETMAAVSMYHFSLERMDEEDIESDQEYFLGVQVQHALVHRCLDGLAKVIMDQITGMGFGSARDVSRHIDHCKRNSGLLHSIMD